MLKDLKWVKIIIDVELLNPFKFGAYFITNLLHCKFEIVIRYYQNITTASEFSNCLTNMSGENYFRLSACSLKYCVNLLQWLLRSAKRK